MIHHDPDYDHDPDFDHVNDKMIRNEYKRTESHNLRNLQVWTSLTSILGSISTPRP